MINLILIDQLLSTILDADLQSKLRDAKYDTPQELAKCADEYIMNKKAKSNSNNLSNNNGNNQRHAKPDQSKFTAQQSTSNTKYTVVCYRCKQLGHKQNQCSMPPLQVPLNQPANHTLNASNIPFQPRPTKKGTQLLCGDETKSSCPFISLKVNNTPQDALIDTGSQRSLILNKQTVCRDFKLREQFQCQ